MAKSVAQFLEESINPNNDLLKSMAQQIENIKEQTTAIQNQLVVASQAVEELIKQADDRSYIYDESEKLIQAKYWKEDQLLATQSFEYDEKGNLIGETWE